MATGFRLPAYEVPNKMLDLAPLNSALDGYQSQMNTNAQFGMAQKRENREQEGFDDAKKQRAIDRMGKIAEAASLEQDPNRRGAMMGALYKMHPELTAKLSENGMDPNDHGTVAQFLKSQVSTYSPLGEKAQLQQIETGKANAGLANAQAGNVGKTDSIREFTFARQNGFTGSYQEWQKTQENSTTKYGLNPIPYTKPDGTIGYMVPNTRGESKALDVPGGGTAAPRATTIQTPTHVITQDQFGNEIKREAKDLSGAARQTTLGKAGGEAEAALPGVVANAEQTVGLINQIRNHPGKDYAIGVAGVLPPIPGTAQAGFLDLVEQAKGSAFLKAIDSLRGTGSISEAEGKAATMAVARMKTARRPEDFWQAMNDYEASISKGVETARQKARVGTPNAGQPQGQPQQGAGGVAPGSYVYDPASGKLMPRGQSDRDRARSTVQGIDR